MKTDLTLATGVQLKRLNPFNPMDNPCYLIDIACVAMQMHTWIANDRESLISFVASTRRIDIFNVSLRASYFSSTSFSLLNALAILVTRTFERNDLEKSKWDGSRKD